MEIKEKMEITRAERRPHVKEARTEHPVLDLVRRRWSPRAFADRPVEPRKLRSILEAARWAPSSFNEQPWRFILAQKEDEAAFEKLLACLNENNRAWAQQAPVLMLTVAKTSFTRNERVNRHSWHDVGLAVGNLLLQATALDLYVHQMAGILPEAARAAYGIPEGYEPVTALAVGYLGDPDALPEARREAEQQARTRRPLREIVFGGSWGEAAPIVLTEDRR